MITMPCGQGFPGVSVFRCISHYLLAPGELSEAGPAFEGQHPAALGHSSAWIMELSWLCPRSSSDSRNDPCQQVNLGTKS